MKTPSTLLALALAASLSFLSARAVTVNGVSIQGSTTAAQSAYDSDINTTNDLIFGLPSTSINTTAGPNYQGPITAIADGAASVSYGANNVFFDNSNIVGGGNSLAQDPVVTINLNTSATGSVTGYNLNQIVSINGWQDHPSESDQNYTVSYSTVADPTQFTLLATVTYAPFDPADDDSSNPQSASMVTVTGLSSAVGVADLQFTFSPYTSPGGVEQAAQMIREIEVYGVADTPEPSVWALMGLGGLILAWRLRHGRIGA